MLMFALALYVPAIILTGGVVGVPVYFVIRHLRLREREVRALEGKTVAVELGTLMAQNTALQKRIEQLESIVTSTDFELSQRIQSAQRDLSLKEMPRNGEAENK
jgi:hypothetical protein